MKDLDQGKKSPFELNSAGAAPKQAAAQNNMDGADPFATFFAARDASYEELKAREEAQQKRMDAEGEVAMSYMTDAMRQIHIEQLIAMANCEKTGLPGMSPGQAVVALKELLARDDHKFVDNLYPGLRAAVDTRYAEVIARRLPGRKKE
jgi:hypothetical protein